MIQPGEYWRIIEDLMKWCWIGLTGSSKTASQPVAAAAWHPEVGRSYQGVRVMHGVAKVIPGWCRRCIRPDLSRVFSQTKVTFQNGPTHQHIIGPGMLWVTGQDVLEAAFFLLAVRSLGKCRLMRGGRWGLGYQMVMMLSHSEAEGAWWILLTQQHVPDSSLGHFINPSQPAQCQGSDKTATSRGSEARRGFTIHLGSSADLMTWMRGGMEARFYVNVLLASHFSSGYDIGLISAVLCSLVL